MQATAIADLVADTARAVLPQTVAPALLTLPPHTLVTAEVWSEERHVRFVGEALYAIHCGARAEWAVVVIESSNLEPGTVQIVSLDDIRITTPAGRRGM
jgi:hypothetical protein